VIAIGGTGAVDVNVAAVAAAGDSAVEGGADVLVASPFCACASDPPR